MTSAVSIFVIIHLTACTLQLAFTIITTYFFYSLPAHHVTQMPLELRDHSFTVHLLQLLLRHRCHCFQLNRQPIHQYKMKTKQKHRHICCTQWYFYSSTLSSVYLN